jgi:hypothetical protein
MRGGKKPLLVLYKSNNAEAFGVEPPITIWACAGRQAKARKKITGSAARAVVRNLGEGRIILLF